MEKSIQIQIDELNRKMDLVLERVGQQCQQNEAYTDLMEDLAIVGRDAFQTAVDELATQNIKVDGEDIKYLFFKILRNIKTFGELMDTLESTMDFIHDIGPVVHDAGIAFTNTLADLEKKGYVSYIKQLGRLVADVKDVVTEEDILRIRQNLPQIGSILRKLTQPEVLKSTDHLAGLLSTMKVDEKLDSKSLFKLARELNKPEVRRTLSYSLRLIAELGKKV